MRRLSLLVFCLVFVVGCGQRYEDALRVYNDESAVLEQLENKRAAAVELTIQGKMKLDEIGEQHIAAISAISPLPESATENIKDVLEQIENKKNDYDSTLAKGLEVIDPKIEAQRKRVAEAKTIRNKLMP